MGLPDWRDPGYLAAGTERQQQAAVVLALLNIMDRLWVYDPVLVGTVPLNIDIADSDLDIICHTEDGVGFQQEVTAAYGGQSGFRIKQTAHNGLPTVVANFEPSVTVNGRAVSFPVELFGQDRPIEQQNAYRHMVVEARLLQIGGEDARHAIRELKTQGLKTEPAFARYFGLNEDDPYQLLLELAALDDAGLRAAVKVND